MAYPAKVALSSLQYLANAVFPYPLKFFYSYGVSAVEVAVLAGLTALAIAAWRTRRAGCARVLALACLGFTVLLSPHLLFPTFTWRVTPAQDRYQYLATLFLMCVASYVVANAAARRGPLQRRMTALAGSALVVVFAGMAAFHTRLYVAPLGIYERTHQALPQHRLATFLFADELARRGQWRQAVQHYEELLFAGPNASAEDWSGRHAANGRYIVPYLAGEPQVAVPAARWYLEQGFVAPAPEAELILSSLLLEATDSELRDEEAGAQMIARFVHRLDQTPRDTHGSWEEYRARAVMLQAAAKASRGDFSGAIGFLERLQSIADMDRRRWPNQQKVREQIAERLAVYRQGRRYFSDDSQRPFIGW
jgi:hypothetical protein